MIYVTGDIHGSHDIHKLNTDNFPTQRQLTKNDYVICCGDFGQVWDNTEQELYWRKWLNDKNFTMLWLDGNHENHDMLNAMPVQEWNGGKVHFICDTVIHLMRGQVYTIDNKKIFTFGGALSIDKHRRKEGVSWWAREMPSNAEYKEGLANLEKHNWEVDYILTHDCSARIFDVLKYNIFINGKYKTHLQDFFEELEERVLFKHWYFGHYHFDFPLDTTHTLIYNELVKLD